MSAVSSGKQGKRTDEVSCISVCDSMQKTHHTTGILDRLRPPQDGLSISFSLVFIRQAILCHAMAFIHGANGEHEKKSERRAGDKGEEVGIGQGVDIVHLESVRDTKLVDEGGHELRVRFEGNEGWAAAGRIGIGGQRHICCCGIGFV